MDARGGSSGGLVSAAVMRGTSPAESGHQRPPPSSWWPRELRLRGDDRPSPRTHPPSRRIQMPRSAKQVSSVRRSGTGFWRRPDPPRAHATTLEDGTHHRSNADIGKIGGAPSRSAVAIAPALRGKRYGYDVFRIRPRLAVARAHRARPGHRFRATGPDAPTAFPERAIPPVRSDTPNSVPSIRMWLTNEELCRACGPIRGSRRWSHHRRCVLPI